MKTRNIPFGYTMENGKIIFHPKAKRFKIYFPIIWTGNPY